MSEGGIYPWKSQNIDSHRGPIGDFKNLNQPLPQLPKGQSWNYDPTSRNWSVVGQTDDNNNKSNNNLSLSSPSSTNENLIEACIGVPVIVNGYTLPPDHEYVLHELQPTDTLQGLCLKYKVNATTLRQINRFSGSSLALAPKQLIIPIKTEKHTLPSKSSNAQNSTITENMTNQGKISTMLNAFKDRTKSELTSLQSQEVSREEALAYLNMNDGNIDDAVAQMMDDYLWERQEKALEIDDCTNHNQQYEQLEKYPLLT